MNNLSRAPRTPFFKPAPLARAAELGDAIDAHLEKLRARVGAGMRSAATVGMVEQHARFIVERLGRRTPLANITGPVIEGWIIAEASGRRADRDGDAVPISASTLRKRVSTFRALLKTAHRAGWIAAVPPFPEIDFVYEPTKNHLRSYDEYRRLFDALPLERAEWVAVATFTGQHPGDVNGMRAWDDADPFAAAPWIRVRNTKNRKRGGVVVPMPDELVRVLGARFRRLGLRAGQPLVRAWSDTARSKCLGRLSKRLGLMHINATALRHTCGTWIVRRLGITKAAMEWLGHSSPKMLATVYAHALPPQLAEITAELNAFAVEPERLPLRISPAIVPARLSARRAGKKPPGHRREILAERTTMTGLRPPRACADG